MLRLVLVGVCLLGAAVLSARHGPPYTPEDALATFTLADGFRIELFAAEPLISDPVAMEVDENGRLFVVEMHGYPLDLSGSGRVMLLTDTDGDGRPDRSVVFADGLRLPNGIMRWKNGVLVTDSPDVLYLEDTDGDGRADVKKVVLTGFARSNPQHTMNTPLYGLDNWIYLANEGPARTVRYHDLFGDPGHDVRYPDRPDGPRLPTDAGGRNVRFKPDTFELEALSARSQFGQTFDAWGHHFLNTNSRHLYHEVIAARYVSRNSAQTVTNVVEQVPDYPIPAELFPVTASPEYQLLTDVGVMTSASGVTCYLADLFPPAYRRATFVAESVHNLVRVDSLRDDGVTFKASRMFDAREFLASSDSWFRPVNFYIGPDGALYVIDFYRKIIEHPEWLDDVTASSNALYEGRDRGRIYRIVPAGAAAPGWMNRIQLGAASPAELVRMLASPNIWWRRHAQRLLVDRKPRAAIDGLFDLASKSDAPLGRLHALWTLEGLGAIRPDTIESALGDSVAGVRENAIRIAEHHLDEPRLGERLLRMGDDPDPKVRYQLLLTLGDLSDARAEALRGRLLVDNVEDTWMQIAALSAPGANPLSLFQAARARVSDRDTPGRRALFSRVAALAARGDAPATRELIDRASAAAEASNDWWRAATLQGLAEGLRGAKPRTGALDGRRGQIAALALRATSGSIRQAARQVLDAIGGGGALDASLASEAERIATDAHGDAGSRADAVSVLALHDGAAYANLFRRLLGAGEPTPVQTAAVRALAALPAPDVANAFIAAWERWTPAVRDEAVRGLVRDPARVGALLDAVAAGKIRATEIDRPLRIRLMMLDDDALRNRARSLFNVAAGSPRAAVERYQAALSRPGDAQRGREVFSRTCTVCHQYRGGDGARFGPDLGEVRSHTPQSLLVDILDPNHAIADGYALWVVKLSDGGSLTGIVGSETPTSITLRLPGGSDTTVPRARIDAMHIADASAMPEGLEGQIDLQQMADLIAFLRRGM